MAVTFGDIAGAEPSTVTFKVETVVIDRNGTNVQREILVLGDPESSVALAKVSTAAPAAGDAGLAVRVIGQSTTVTVAALPAGSSGVTVNAWGAGLVSSAMPAAGSSGLLVRPVWSSTGADQPVRPIFSSTAADNPVQISGNSTVAFAANSAVAINGPVSTGAPATSDTGVVVRQVGYSTIVTVAAMPANSSQVQVTALPAGSTSVTIAAITGPVSTGSPATGDTGLIVRQVGYSTVVSVAAFPANSSQVEVRAMPAGSTIVTVAAMPANSSIVQVSAFSAGLISSAAAAGNSSGLVVRVVADDLTTFASTSAFATSTAATVSASTALAKYVTAYSFTSTDLTATVLRFMASGSSLIWPVRMQATSSAITGANLAVGAGYLFKCPAASSLALHASGSSRAGWTVAVSYYLAP